MTTTAKKGGRADDLLALQGKLAKVRELKAHYQQQKDEAERWIRICEHDEEWLTRDIAKLGADETQENNHPEVIECTNETAYAERIAAYNRLSERGYTCLSCDGTGQTPDGASCPSCIGGQRVYPEPYENGGEL